ncbi:hypothetical protein NLX83_21570 [Allokutzneria sp. A3M-2-11 16]|uniref:hypothetical protein n=1 Tax=Allokutzneria sp. A3M-2-11 16 TaxID=2962043 RepID=UPI0020B66CE5|nr:hypothetical protein [Allokutzneria sp. A3M-2-11 16]MCP3801859.1 hypothetical protein [Allokutzneria sp. A3M-2-11 16]
MARAVGSADENEAAQAESDFPLVDINYRPPKRHAFHPPLDLERAAILVKKLTDKDVPATILKKDLRYARLRPAISLAAALMIPALFYFGCTQVWEMLKAGPSTPLAPWKVVVSAVPLCIMAFFGGRSTIAAVVNIWHPYHRFQWEMRKAERALKGKHISPFSRNHMVLTANITGRAARHLFRSVQDGRLSWRSPPAVSERALHLSAPLINIDLEENPKASRKQYAQFLRDASIIVALDVPDLLPDLRALYSEIAFAYREDEPIPDRYAQYLDPMRNYSRSSVAKDFLYPLASWGSLVTSLLALIVSLSR